MGRTRTTRRRGNSRPAKANQSKQLHQQKSNPTHSKGVGVKRMKISKRQRAKLKIKRLTRPPRRITVKNRGRLRRKMIIRRTVIYPDSTGGTY